MSVSIWYHGTDLSSGLAFLNGMDLDAAEAAARKKDGPPGFFLAEKVNDAGYFAIRRHGFIIEFHLSDVAYKRLQRAGTLRRPIPQGPYTLQRG